MLALPVFSRFGPPALANDRITLRVPVMADYAEWAALRRESRSFLEPWEPCWASDELERAGWKRRIRRYRTEYAAGTVIPFLIFENAQGRMVGGITLGNIRHGVSQSAQIGYWTGAAYAGRGYMTEAVRLLATHAFGPMRLHRLEAACIPDNARSIRVLEKAGFQREGLLRSYLRINGVWRDHFLYALIADEHGADEKRLKA